MTAAPGTRCRGCRPCPCTSRRSIPCSPLRRSLLTDAGHVAAHKEVIRLLSLLLLAHLLLNALLDQSLDLAVLEVLEGQESE